MTIGKDRFNTHVASKALTVGTGKGGAATEFIEDEMSTVEGFFQMPVVDVSEDGYPSSAAANKFPAFIDPTDGDGALLIYNGSTGVWIKISGTAV